MNKTVNVCVHQRSIDKNKTTKKSVSNMKLKKQQQINFFLDLHNYLIYYWDIFLFYKA